MGEVIKRHALSGAIKAAREAAGMTQDELAESIGVHQMTVSRWERGTIVPKEDQLASLANLFGTTPSSLRYGNGSTPLMVRESPYDRVPPIAQSLPKNVRVWLHAFLLELAEADVPDEQIESVKAALTSPENFTFFVGMQPADYTEDKIMGGLKDLALCIRGVLRDRGFKVKAK